jgi:(S)-ureidoglycine aminohydrolase
MKIVLTCLVHLIVVTAFAQMQPVSSGVYTWKDWLIKEPDHRETRRIISGTTPEFDYFEAHATTQEKGALPRPAHAQKDREELIIIKEGTMKCTIGNQTKTIGAGSVILIPPQEMQSFENVGNGPLTYYVFVFRSKKPMDLERSKKAGGALILNVDSLEFKKTEKGGGRKYFDRPTAMCENFEMHVTQLQGAGPSHAPHQHIETEVILIIEGSTSMVIDGKTYTGGPGDVYIMESGKMHGITNVADKPCSYFAFKWR